MQLDALSIGQRIVKRLTHERMDEAAAPNSLRNRHEQLGMKMNEKAQQLRKFETGVLKPDEFLAKKLERFLGIKLYVSADEQ